MINFYKELLKTISFYKKCFGKLLRLIPRVQCEYLSTQVLWATAQLLVSRVSFFYLLDVIKGNEEGR